MNFWLNDLNVLLDNYGDFIPTKKMTNNEKANAIFRFGIYFGIILCLLGMDTTWLSVSVILIIISIIIGKTENFDSQIKCTKPTKNNPYMNFTLGDHINNPNKPKACGLNEQTRKEELINFYHNLNGDLTLNKFELYSRSNNDRNFYTMPSTTLVNDQESFAKFLYGDFGKCKSEGKDCLKHRDNRFHKGRYYLQY